MGTYSKTQWFHFDDGSNPYGVWGDRLDEFFRMIVAWQPRMIDVAYFQCPKEPTQAYYGLPVGQAYQFRKNALREFAREYQRVFADLEMSLEDVNYYANFFEVYGRKYGLLTEFRENGIC